MIKKVLLKAVTVILIASFSFDTACYGLATLPASQNPAAKLEISAALRRTQIRHAESDDAVRLLRTNNASCLLLSSGKYLVAKEVAGDDLKLLRAIIHEDIEAVMQILAKEDRYKYLGIKELILRRFPPAKENNLPIELFVNHTVARAFEWLVLTRQGMILRGDIPESERSFIEAIEPMINANRHNYFTAEFWDSRTSGERIRSALNRGLRFYRVASSHSKGRDSFRGGYRGVEPDEYSARISVTQEERAKITEFQKDNLWKYVGEGFRFLDMGTDLKEAVYFRDDHDRMAAVRIGDRIGIDSDLALIAPPFNPENPDSKVFQTLVNDMMDPDGVGYCIPYLVRGNDRRLAEDYLERNIDRFTEFLAAAQHFNIKINDLSGMEDLLRADLIKAAGDYPIPDKCRYDIIPAIYPVILRYSGSFGSLRKLTTGLARRRLPFWQILKFGVPLMVKRITAYILNQSILKKPMDMILKQDSIVFDLAITILRRSA
jgi:hypothetical protein